MLPLPRIALHVPRSLDDALDVLAARGRAARLLAGGTDLVPNLKHGLFDAEVLIALKRVPGLRGVATDDAGGLRVGALTPLSHLAADPVLQEAYPALALTVGQIAGPQLRNMGTIGGNLCLDTRCTWYNQTEDWRIALGYCLKRTGTVCHVVPGGTRCVAAVSSASSSTPDSTEIVSRRSSASGRRSWTAIARSASTSAWRSTGSRTRTWAPDGTSSVVSRMTRNTVVSSRFGSSASRRRTSSASPYSRSMMTARG